jgi:hypothetical protein
VLAAPPVWHGCKKFDSDRRAWRRATWAVDHTLSNNTDAQVVGFDVLIKLQEATLITLTEANIFANYGRVANRLRIQMAICLPRRILNLRRMPVTTAERFKKNAPRRALEPAARRAAAEDRARC